MRVEVPHHPADWFGDARHYDRCLYCAGPVEERDHVPSLILLDDPLPQEPPWVPSCARCNRSFSEDEQYVACLVEVALVGAVEDSKVSRANILPLLDHVPSTTGKATLRQRLEHARQVDLLGNVSWRVDADAVRSVALKLARGHALWEMDDAHHGDPPDRLVVRPLAIMSPSERESFERAPSTNVFPEVGSRALERLVELGPSGGSAPWVVVQPGRYRFLACPNQGTLIRIVLSEYLGCEIHWSD